MTVRKSQGNKTNIEDEKRKEEKKHEQGRTLSRQNFHSNQNELRRDYKSHKGKFNETTTGYKSLWCFGPYGPPACIVYILDGSETRLLRIVVVAEGRSSIDFTGRWNQVKKLAVRSVSEQYWSSAVFIQCPWFYEGVGKYPKKKKKKGEIVIYDLLQAPDLRLTSTSNEIYATWLPASFCTFVFCFLLVTLEDFP